MKTGIGFFDHMLEQIAKHGGFASSCAATATCMSTSITPWKTWHLALGSALAGGAGDKRGIGRYGFLLPMDESGPGRA